MFPTSNLSPPLSYHIPNITNIGYAQTFEEAYERTENLYRVEERGEDENPPVEDFLVWRDLRVFDGTCKVPSPLQYFYFWFGKQLLRCLVQKHL